MDSDWRGICLGGGKGWVGTGLARKCTIKCTFKHPGPWGGHELPGGSFPRVLEPLWIYQSCLHPASRCAELPRGGKQAFVEYGGRIAGAGLPAWSCAPSCAPSCILTRSEPPQFHSISSFNRCMSRDGCGLWVKRREGGEFDQLLVSSSGCASSCSQGPVVTTAGTMRV